MHLSGRISALQLTLFSCLIVFVVLTSAQQSGLWSNRGSRHVKDYSSRWQPVQFKPNERRAALIHRKMHHYIALKERNMKELEEYALQISDPTNLAMYGKHLSLDQLTEMIAPSQENINKVIDWLKSNGVEEIELLASRSWIKFKAPLGITQRLVNCQFQEFKFHRSDETVVRCVGGYSVPKHLDDIVEFVTPVVGFPRTTTSTAVKYIRDKKAERDDEPDVSPKVCRERYNINTPLVDMQVNNTQAVCQTDESYSNEDLQQFFEQYIPELAGQKVLGTLGNLPNEDGVSDTEASLDIQYIMGLGAFGPSYTYNYNDENGDEIKVFYDWVTDLAKDARPPLVHSVSYGEYGGNYPIEEVNRVSNEFMKLGVRGVTILYASGDDGVGCNDDCTHFEFPYPSSPWITLVGSTRLLKNSNGYEEIGSSFSTGGFSDDFAMPKWQKQQVENYLQNCPDLPSDSFYNKSGRALPDISAVGENVQVIVGGSVEPVAGTSCSSPMVAGMISLFNGLRLKAGKSSLGFVNPLLYQTYGTNPNTFFDVTKGNNGYSCCSGFNAFKGWDPVVGLGTPNFAEIWKAIEKLP